MESAASPSFESRFEQLCYAREVLRVEGAALIRLAGALGDEFCDATDLLFDCQGCVIVTGMGKAGLVGQKIAATLASTGSRSHSLHPGEAIHGDLGRIGEEDVVLALSFSGETEEIVRLLPPLRAAAAPILAITGNPTSSLSRAANVTLCLGGIKEACSLGLAPSTSTTAMLALGDALALVLSRRRRFRHEDFARFHPGGSLGRKLALVDEVMRPLAECRVASQDRTVCDVLVEVSRQGRRTGAIMLVDTKGHLVGVFTDSDLARLLETRSEGVLETPVHSVMTHSPRSIVSGSRLSEAMLILAENKISELPVVDLDGTPIGLVDITDVVSLLPASEMRPRDEPTNSTIDSELRTLPFPTDASEI